MERPIIFSGPMIRALLAGTKSQTRRVVNHPLAVDAVRFEADSESNEDWYPIQEGGACDGSIISPYGLKGDVLWVRENWKAEYVGIDDVQVTYFADSVKRHYPRRLRPPGWILPKHATLGRVVPSIHMPRFISRLKLTLLEDSRPMRLQAMADEDAIAEGFTDVEAFKGLWDSINSGNPWDDDPWVWMLRFTVEQFPLAPGVVEK